MNQDANTPPPPSPSATQRPQRTETRISAFVNADCQVQDPTTGEWVNAGIRDLSLWGACLLLPNRFEVGQTLNVHLLRPERRFRRTLRVCVRHAEIIAPNDAWLHGCEFAEGLDAADVQAIL